MRPHRHSTSKKDAHSHSNISTKQQYHHHHSKSSRTTISSARKTKKTTKTKGVAASSRSPSAGERKEKTNRTPDRRQLNLAITVEKPSSSSAATKESNYFCNKDIVVVVEPQAQLSTPGSCTLLSANSSPVRQHQASSTMPSQESTASSRSASSSSLASSSAATASASSSSSFCRHCLRPQRELQLRSVRHRRHKKSEINQELPITSHNNSQHQLGVAQLSVLSDGVHNRRTSKRSMATTSSNATAVRAGGSQRTAHRSSAGTLAFTPEATAVTRHRHRHMQRFSQPLTTTTIRIESEGGGAASTSRNQNLNQNLSVTTPNLLTWSISQQISTLNTHTTSSWITLHTDNWN